MAIVSYELRSKQSLCTGCYPCNKGPIYVYIHMYMSSTGNDQAAKDSDLQSSAATSSLAGLVAQRRNRLEHGNEELPVAGLYLRLT